MKKETSSPVWTMASFIPVYGGDINAARTMVDALSDVSSGALVPMADNLAQATPGKLFQDGTINVSALQAVAIRSPIARRRSRAPTKRCRVLAIHISPR